MSREDGYRFAKMLTEALYDIKVHEDKNLRVIEEELCAALGRDSVSTVDYWRRGHVPDKWSDVEKLAEEILRRTNFDASWLEAFFAAAGVPNYQATATDFYAVETQHRRSTPSSTIIHRPYPTRVVGRRGLTDEIMSVLQNPDMPLIVSIDGMGGIGKTALVSWTAHLCVQENLFEELIWISSTAPIYPQPRDLQLGALTYESVLSQIGDYLSVPGIRRRSLSEKEVRIKLALSDRQVLMVLDNLETAKTLQNEIADRLATLLGPSKAVVVSRHRFTGDYYSIHLEGLGGEDGLDFLHKQAADRRMNRLVGADDQELARITETTGGSPLAMKLVVGQLMHLPISIVLESLKNVRSIQSRGEQDDYVNLYRYIFMPSWQLLPVESKQLLLSMTHFAPGVGDVMDLIQKVSGLDDLALINAIDQLWEVSFLEVAESSALRRVRYYLHALTQYFVLSDILRSS